jgi:cytidylate kinase
VGGKGEGKSYLTAQLARALGYPGVESMFLYKDMSARDVLQVSALCCSAL